MEAYIVVGISAVIVLGILGWAVFTYFFSAVKSTGAAQTEVDQARASIDLAQKNAIKDEKQDAVMMTSSTPEDTAKKLDEGTF